MSYGPEPPALAWMEGRAKAPKRRDDTRLPAGGPMVGMFWHHCKSQRKESENRERRCGKPPYDRLLDNPVLRADYRPTAA